MFQLKQILVLLVSSWPELIKLFHCSLGWSLATSFLGNVGFGLLFFFIFNKADWYKVSYMESIITIDWLLYRFTNHASMLCRKHSCSYVSYSISILPSAIVQSCCRQVCPILNDNFSLSTELFSVLLNTLSIIYKGQWYYLWVGDLFQIKQSDALRDRAPMQSKLSNVYRAPETKCGFYSFFFVFDFTFFCLYLFSLSVMPFSLSPHGTTYQPALSWKHWQ